MSLMLPPDAEGLINALLVLTAGDVFPKADEDLLRNLGDSTRGFGKNLLAETSGLDSLVAAVVQGLETSAGRQFARYGYQLDKYGSGLVGQANVIGELLDDFALSAENAKYQMIIGATLTASMIAWGFASPWGAALMPSFISGLRTAVVDIFNNYINTLTRMLYGAATEGVQELSTAFLSQYIQVIEGNRKDYDTEDLAHSAGFGAGAGFIAPLFSSVISATSSAFHRNMDDVRRHLIGNDSANLPPPSVRNQLTNATLTEGLTELVISAATLPLGGALTGLGYSTVSGIFSGFTETAADLTGEHIYAKHHPPKPPPNNNASNNFGNPGSGDPGNPNSGDDRDLITDDFASTINSPSTNTPSADDPNTPPNNSDLISGGPFESAITPPGSNTPGTNTPATGDPGDPNPPAGDSFLDLNDSANGPDNTSSSAPGDPFGSTLAPSGNDPTDPNTSSAPPLSDDNNPALAMPGNNDTIPDHPSPPPSQEDNPEQSAWSSGWSDTDSIDNDPTAASATNSPDESSLEFDDDRDDFDLAINPPDGDTFGTPTDAGSDIQSFGPSDEAQSEAWSDSSIDGDASLITSAPPATTASIRDSDGQRFLVSEIPPGQSPPGSPFASSFGTSDSGLYGIAPTADSATQSDNADVDPDASFFPDSAFISPTGTPIPDDQRFLVSETPPGQSPPSSPYASSHGTSDPGLHGITQAANLAPSDSASQPDDADIDSHAGSLDDSAFDISPTSIPAPASSHDSERAMSDNGDSGSVQSSVLGPGSASIQSKDYTEPSRYSPDGETIDATLSLPTDPSDSSDSSDTSPGRDGDSTGSIVFPSSDSTLSTESDITTSDTPSSVQSLTMSEDDDTMPSVTAPAPLPTDELDIGVRQPRGVGRGREWIRSIHPYPDLPSIAEERSDLESEDDVIRVDDLFENTGDDFAGDFVEFSDSDSDIPAPTGSSTQPGDTDVNRRSRVSDATSSTSTSDIVWRRHSDQGTQDNGAEDAASFSFLSVDSPTDTDLDITTSDTPSSVQSITMSEDDDTMPVVTSDGSVPIYIYSDDTSPEHSARESHHDGDEDSDHSSDTDYLPPLPPTPIPPSTASIRTQVSDDDEFMSVRTADATSHPTTREPSPQGTQDELPTIISIGSSPSSAEDHISVITDNVDGIPSYTSAEYSPADTDYDSVQSIVMPAEEEIQSIPDNVNNTSSAESTPDSADYGSATSSVVMPADEEIASIPDGTGRKTESTTTDDTGYSTAESNPGRETTTSTSTSTDDETTDNPYKTADETQSTTDYETASDDTGYNSTRSVWMPAEEEIGSIPDETGHETRSTPSDTDYATATSSVVQPANEDIKSVSDDAAPEKSDIETPPTSDIIIDPTHQTPPKSPTTESSSPATDQTSAAPIPRGGVVGRGRERIRGIHSRRELKALDGEVSDIEREDDVIRIDDVIEIDGDKNNQKKTDREWEERQGGVQWSWDNESPLPGAGAIWNVPPTRRPSTDEEPDGERPITVDIDTAPPKRRARVQQPAEIVVEESDSVVRKRARKTRAQPKMSTLMESASPSEESSVSETEKSPSSDERSEILNPWAGGPPRFTAAQKGKRPIRPTTPEPKPEPEPEPEPTFVEPEPVVVSVGVPKGRLPNTNRLIQGITAHVPQLANTSDSTWNNFGREVLAKFRQIAYGVRRPDPEQQAPDDDNQNIEQPPISYPFVVDGVPLLISLELTFDRRVPDPSAERDGLIGNPLRRKQGAVKGLETVNAIYDLGPTTKSLGGSTAYTQLNLGPGLVFPRGIAEPGGTVALELNVNQNLRNIGTVKDAEIGKVENSRTDLEFLAYRHRWVVRVLNPNGTAVPIDIPAPHRNAPERVVLAVAAPYVRLPDGIPPASIEEVDDDEQQVLRILRDTSRDESRDARNVEVRKLRIPKPVLGTQHPWLRPRPDPTYSVLPDHYFASGLTNLDQLFQHAITLLQDEGIRDFDVPSIKTKLWNLEANLHFAADRERPQGYRFPVFDKNARIIALIQINSELFPQQFDGVERIGAVSDKVHIEDVATAIDGITGGHVLSQAFGGRATLSSPLTIPDRIGVAPSISAALKPSNTNGISTSRVSLWVHVARFVGRTGAYLIPMRHTVRVFNPNRRRDVLAGNDTEREPRVLTTPGTGLVRTPEKEASVRRWPLEPNSPFRSFNPNLIEGEQGNRKDFQRGVGMGLVRVADTTVRQIHQYLTTELEREGFLFIDQQHDGEPLDRTRLDSVRVHKQMDNAIALDKLVSQAALRTNYDQIHQGGYTFTLEIPSNMPVPTVPSGRTRFAKIIIAAEASLDRNGRPVAHFRGTTKDFHTVNLAMGMSTVGQSVGGSTDIRGGTKVGIFKNQLRNLTLAGLGAAYTRGANNETKLLNNRPELLEYSHEVEKWEVHSDWMVQIQFQDAPVLSSTPPEADLPFQPYPLPNQQAIVHTLDFINGMDRQVPALRQPGRMNRPPDEFLDNAVVYKLDATGIRQDLLNLLGPFSGPAGYADQELSSLAGTTTMRAWLKEAIRDKVYTDLPFIPGWRKDLHGTASIKAQILGFDFQGATKESFTLGIIKLGLISTTMSQSDVLSILPEMLNDYTVTGQVGGPAELSGNISAAPSYTFGSSETVSREAAFERIQLKFGPAYKFRALLRFRITTSTEFGGKFIASNLRPGRPGHAERQRRRDPQQQINFAPKDPRVPVIRDAPDPDAEPGPDQANEVVLERYAEFLIPERDALVGFAAGTMPMTNEQLGNVMQRFTETKDGDAPPISGTLAANVVNRWHELDPDVERSNNLATAIVERYETDDPRYFVDPDVLERLLLLAPQLNVDEKAEPFTLPRYLTEPAPHERVLGHSGIRSVDYRKYDNDTFEIGDPTSIYDTIRDLVADIDEQALGHDIVHRGQQSRLKSIQGIAEGLESVLGRGREDAFIDDFMGADGYTFYLVNPRNWFLSSIIEINVKTQLKNDFRMVDISPMSGMENYTHGYTGKSHNRTVGGALSAAAKLTLAIEKDNNIYRGAAKGKAESGASRSLGTSTTEVSEQTLYDWSGHVDYSVTHETLVSVRRLNMNQRWLNNMLLALDWSSPANFWDSLTQMGSRRDAGVVGDYQRLFGRVIIELPMSIAMGREPAVQPPIRHNSRYVGPLPGDATVSGNALDGLGPAAQRMLREIQQQAWGFEKLRRAVLNNEPFQSNPSAAMKALLTRTSLNGHLPAVFGGQVHRLAENLIIPGYPELVITVDLIGELERDGAEVMHEMDGGGSGRYNKFLSSTSHSVKVDNWRGTLGGDLGFLNKRPGPDTGQPGGPRPDQVASGATEGGRGTSLGVTGSENRNLRSEQHWKSLVKGQNGVFDEKLYVVQFPSRVRLIATVRNRNIPYFNPWTEPFRTNWVEGPVYVTMSKSQYVALMNSDYEPTPQFVQEIAEPGTDRTRPDQLAIDPHFQRANFDPDRAQPRDEHLPAPPGRTPLPGPQGPRPNLYASSYRSNAPHAVSSTTFPSRGPTPPDDPPYVGPHTYPPRLYPDPAYGYPPPGMPPHPYYEAQSHMDALRGPGTANQAYLYDLGQFHTSQFRANSPGSASVEFGSPRPSERSEGPPPGRDRDDYPNSPHPRAMPLARANQLRRFQEDQIPGHFQGMPAQATADNAMRELMDATDHFPQLDTLWSALRAIGRQHMELVFNRESPWDIDRFIRLVLSVEGRIRAGENPEDVREMVAGQFTDATAPGTPVRDRTERWVHGVSRVSRPPTETSALFPESSPARRGGRSPLPSITEEVPRRTEQARQPRQAPPPVEQILVDTETEQEGLGGIAFAMRIRNSRPDGMDRDRLNDLVDNYYRVLGDHGVPEALHAFLGTDRADQVLIRLLNVLDTAKDPTVATEHLQVTMEQLTRDDRAREALADMEPADIYRWIMQQTFDPDNAMPQQYEETSPRRPESFPDEAILVQQEDPVRQEDPEEDLEDDLNPAERAAWNTYVPDLRAAGVLRAIFERVGEDHGSYVLAMLLEHLNNAGAPPREAAINTLRVINELPDRVLTMGLSPEELASLIYFRSNNQIARENLDTWAAADLIRLMNEIMRRRRPPVTQQWAQQVPPLHYLPSPLDTQRTTFVNDVAELKGKDAKKDANVRFHALSFHGVIDELNRLASTNAILAHDVLLEMLMERRNFAEAFNVIPDDLLLRIFEADPRWTAGRFMALLQGLDNMAGTPTQAQIRAFIDEQLRKDPPRKLRKKR